jgi:putative pyruvate formate lyase activating enzyme
MWRLLRSDATTILKDKMARKSLARYFAVMENTKAAKFTIAKILPAEPSKDDSTEKLWAKHARLKAGFHKLEERIDAQHAQPEKTLAPEKSYLDLKIEIATRILQRCHFCVRRCGINRIEKNVGFCGCGSETVVSSIFEHLGEEAELVPSGTIFTMGCTMRCKHCQNWTISQWKEKGETFTPESLAKEVEKLRMNGCRNANLVGGEPTPWLQQWLTTFKHVKVNIPVVWNSNSYYSPETAELLAGFVDVYLLDFKYGPGNCAERISDAPDYWKVCTYNHLKAKEHGELIIRVLVLPNHLECCTKPILNWIADNLGKETRVNVMFQYRPEWRASEIPELQRRLTKGEMEEAVGLANEAQLANFIT